MAGVNRVVIIGHATRDASLSHTQGGTAVLEFSLAVNSREKDGDEWKDRADFFDVVLFGTQAESLAKYVLKGKMVGVDGRLRQERWETKDDPPQKRTKIRIVAQSIELLGKRGETSDADAPSPAEQPDFGSTTDDDIPF